MVSSVTVIARLHVICDVILIAVSLIRRRSLRIRRLKGGKSLDIRIMMNF